MVSVLILLVACFVVSCHFLWRIIWYYCWLIHIIWQWHVSLFTFRPNKVVWHGTDKYGVRQTEGYCDAWNSNSRHRNGLASNLLRGKLLDQEKYPCNTLSIVLCLEISSQEDNNWVTRTKRNVQNISSDIFSSSSSDMNLLSQLVSEYDEEE